MSVAVEWLVPLLLIREDLGLDLSSNTEHLDGSFSWFSSVHPGECWIIPLISLSVPDYIIRCGLFNDGVIGSDYTASNNKMMVNNKKMWKEDADDYSVIILSFGAI
jgi:hypothetical protein